MIIEIARNFHPDELKLIKGVLPGFYQTTTRGSLESCPIFITWSDDHRNRTQVSPGWAKTNQRGSTRVLSSKDLMIIKIVCQFHSDRLKLMNKISRGFHHKLVWIPTKHQGWSSLCSFLGSTNYKIKIRDPFYI